jgi:hypothetical protein
MNKRGQLTLFIIVAIVIVTATLFYFFFLPAGSINEQFISGKGLKSDISNTRENLFDCIDSTAKDATIVIGLQGGHYRRPDKFYELQLTFLSYHYYEGQLFSPSLEEVEERISSFINNNLIDCFNKKEYPVKLNFTVPKTTTKLVDNEAIINVNLDITLEAEKTTHIININEKEFRIATKLKGMLEMAEYLTEYHKTDPKFYCVNCLSIMGYERGLNVEMLPFIENDTKEIIIYENQTNTPNLAMFVYLNKYTGDEVSPTFN